MKKRMIPAILASLMLLLTGCGGEKAVDAATEADASSTVTETQTVTKTEATKEKEKFGTDFTIDDLAEANSATLLLKKYGTVKCEKSWTGTVAEDYYFLRNGKRCFAEKSTEYGETELYACCENICYSPGEDGVYESTDYIGEISEIESGAFAYEDGISATVDYGEVINVTDNGDTYSFSIRSEYDSPDQARTEYVADAYDLKLLSAKREDEQGDGEATVFEFEYGCEVDDLGMFDGWDRPLRTVTFESLDDGTKFSVELADNIEFIPEFNSEIKMYFDRECTKKYSFPKDGKDYTVYYS